MAMKTVIESETRPEAYSKLVPAAMADQKELVAVRLLVKVPAAEAKPETKESTVEEK